MDSHLSITKKLMERALSVEMERVAKLSRENSRLR
jgi:hypothetical protein